MNKFSLTTIWHIPAPLSLVWDAIVDTDNWPGWWQYVIRVEQLSPGMETGLYNIRRYHWETCLPYQLTIDLCITCLVPYRRIETSVTGDLKGQGSCLLSSQNDYTVIHYQWNVCLNKFWMKLIAPLAYPIFKWNHQRVMKQGELSLINYLNNLSDR